MNPKGSAGTSPLWGVCLADPLKQAAPGALKMTDMKLQDMKLTDQVAGHEIAGHENGRPNSRA